MKLAVVARLMFALSRRVGAKRRPGNNAYRSVGLVGLFFGK